MWFNLPDCKKCKIPDLTWDETYHENTGQWRLYDPAKEQPHKCPVIPKPILVKMTVCPKCNPLTRKPISAKKLQDHIKKEHIDWVEE